jgi:GDP-mannose 4,6-dehydratase
MSKRSRILVTGATGFIGSNLAPILVDKGYEVFGLERYVTGRYVLGQKKKVKTVFCDIREAFSVTKAIRKIHPDVVIHLASISPVTYSYDHPQEITETNLLGTINIAEACLREVPSFKQFLYASTSETYGNGPSPKKEETTQNPTSPYATSKLASEKYLLYMLEAYGFPITILRNFNTYGRKENSHFVVERTIVQMLKNEAVYLGNPSPIRDLMFVDDHIDSYLVCIENQKAIGEIFNFCTGKGTSIEQLANLVANLTSYNGEVHWNTIPERPADIEVLVGNYEKAKRVLDWNPKFTLEKGLKKTIEFWKNNNHG